MTSASELFYTRRSRFGRNSDTFEVGSHSFVDRGSRRGRYPANSHHHSNTYTRRDRIELDGCDPPRRVPNHSRQPHFHRFSHSPQDRDFIRPEQGGHQFTSGNAIHSGNQSNVLDRAQFSGNDRLPGAVLLARDRLVHRLRGVTLPSSGSRQRNQISQIDSRSEMLIGEVRRLVDAGDGETDLSRDWLVTMNSVTNSISRLTSNKPPGLTQEELNSLRIEVFSEEGDKEDTSREITDCSICLESFLEGDELIHLPCAHRYHVCCLDPWVRSCGECPYCRGRITVDTDGVEHVEGFEL